MQCMDGFVICWRWINRVDLPVGCWFVCDLHIELACVVVGKQAMNSVSVVGEIIMLMLGIYRNSCHHEPGCKGCVYLPAVGSRARARPTQTHGTEGTIHRLWTMSGGQYSKTVSFTFVLINWHQFSFQSNSNLFSTQTNNLKGKC